MGTLHALHDRPDSAEPYAPVNLRPPDRCKLLKFEGDTECYRNIYDAVAVQYCRGEKSRDGYHIVELCDCAGLQLRWIEVQDNGWLCVRPGKFGGYCRIYRWGEYEIVGRVFQFIRPTETDERWELIKGPAFAPADADESTLPLIAISGHLR